MGFLGGQEIVILLVIVILLFGAKKIPELAKGLGTGLKEFKKASSDVEKQLDVNDDSSKKENTSNKNGGGDSK